MSRICRVDLIEGESFHCTYFGVSEAPALMEFRGLLVLGHDNTKYQYLRWIDVEAKKYVPMTNIKEITHFAVKPGSIEPRD